MFIKLELTKDFNYLTIKIVQVLIISRVSSLYSILIIELFI